MIVIVVGFIAGGAFAQEPAAPVKHRIVKIKDLIEDFQEAAWTVTAQSGSQYGAAIGGVERVKQGEIRGYFDLSGNFVETDRVESKTVDIEAQALSTENVSQVRGAFTLQIPPLKRVQLEIMYDLNADETGKAPEGEFFVEVFERNRVNPAEWVKMGELSQKNDRKMEEPPVKQMGNERYIGRSYVANLSEWSGKEIRMDVVSAFANSQSATPKGRWICMKMMGATFDFSFGRTKEKIQPGTSSAKSVRRMYAEKQVKRPSLTPATIDGEFDYGDSITVPGIGNYPESFKIIRNSDVSSSWFLAYFQAGISYYNDLVNGWPGTGSVVCDLYSTNANFYNVSNTVFNNSMIRDINSVLYRSSNSNYPVWRALYPVREEDHWANGMTAIGSAFKDGSYVHAFFHAEDWYKNGSTKNVGYIWQKDAQGNWIIDPVTNKPQRFYSPNYFWAYCSIGYARSNYNDPYHLNFTESTSDGVNDGQIITSPQSEDELYEQDGEYPSGYIFGVAHPLLLKKDSFLYLYYNRFLEYKYLDLPGVHYRYVPKSQGGIGREGCALCIAMTNYSDVTHPDYTSRPNWWYKRYNGIFNSPGLGGNSTPLFDLDDGSPHYGYLVPVSVMDHQGLDEYLYVFMNPPDRDRTSNRMYLCLSNNKCPYDLSDCIEVELPGSHTFCLDMVHEDGYDTVGNGELMKIYAHEPLPGGGFGMVKYQFYYP